MSKKEKAGIRITVFRNKLYSMNEVLDDLNHQFMRRLEKEGLVTLRELYIDGTKIEANANRYTFVWRGTLNYHLVNLLDTIDALYTKYNTFLHENGYGPKYDFGDAHMFMVEGMDKVRKVIEENRKRRSPKITLKNRSRGFCAQKTGRKKKRDNSLVAQGYEKA